MANAPSIGSPRRRVPSSSNDPVALATEWLGELPYGQALALQEAAVRDRMAGRTGDRLLLLEHPQVVTLGRSTNPANLRADEAELRASGVDVYEVGRGGDVTYHAPGQLVGYPILDLDELDRRDVHQHLRTIESALIDVLEALEVPATRIPGWTGVFVDRSRSTRRAGRERKIASIGVGVRRWVTFHGFALNVSIDLAGFESIVPCGLAEVEMTSIAREAEHGAAFDARENGLLDARVRTLVADAMKRHLGPSPAA